MSEEKSDNLRCMICKRHTQVLFHITCSNINFQNCTKIICPRCLMADQLAIFELTKINFPEEAEGIKKLTELLLQHKKEIDAELLKKAREMANKGISDD